MAKKRSWGSLILEELRAVKSGKRDLRKFGITMCVAIAVLGALFLWRGRGEPMWFFGIAAAFLLLGLVAPVVLRPVQKVWMAFALVLGWVMTRVILTIVFYIGVTPIAFIARIVGKKFLDLGFEPDRESYWVKRPEPTTGRERYLNQF
ncbi:MAG: SxtJ family membrane protein [Candidatus Eisenbacteria bacterium]